MPFTLQTGHWLGWLAETSFIETNPSEKIELPKEEHRLPSSYLTLDEVETSLGIVERANADRRQRLDEERLPLGRLRDV